MKLLPSPSTSSSSTTTPFDANMCTSKSATASCLAGILRRILCSRSLPTHPSDQITEINSVACDSKNQEHTKSNENVEVTPCSPGIVARLMGLESLPATTSANMQGSANSILRSRSMNSLEFRGETHEMQEQHRRVRSTLSFRDLPIFFLEPENEEFFVLSFDNGGDSKEVRSKVRKCEVDHREWGEKRREKCQSKKNGREKTMPKQNEADEIINNMISSDLDETKGVGNTDKIQNYCENPSVAFQEAKTSNWRTHKEVVLDSAKFRKKEKNRCIIKNEETECSLEDSSPVSVLDFDQFIMDPDVPTSEEETESTESNSRRKLSAEHDNCNHFSQRGDNNLIVNYRNSQKLEEICDRSRKKVCHCKDYLNIWGNICRLAEAQVIESNWRQKRICKFEDFEDISTSFGLQILDQLLEELVEQLA